MTSFARSLRRLRPAVTRIGDVVAETPHQLQKTSHIHSSCHRVFNPAQTNLFKNHSFTASSRAISLHAAKLTNGAAETSRAGPLVEYERRISSGELVDGDRCQVATLTELQRLYDELVQSADECQLDRNVEKPVRSGWLWSRLLSHPSFSPVKGLYLYGGVGTGKTMLMDLFFDQLILQAL